MNRNEYEEVKVFGFIPALEKEDNYYFCLGGIYLYRMFVGVIESILYLQGGGQFTIKSKEINFISNSIHIHVNFVLWLLAIFGCVIFLGVSADINDHEAFLLCGLVFSITKLWQVMCYEVLVFQANIANN